MKNITKILFGVVAVAFGIIFLGDAFNLWNMGDFSGWWTLFLIVPAIANMISSRVNWFNVLLLAVGIWLLIGAQDWVPSEILNKVALSAGLLLLGIWLLFSDIFKKNKKNKIINNNQNENPYNNCSYNNININDNDFPSFLSFFSFNQSRNSSRKLKGGNATALFGGMELDLRDAIPAGNVTFNLNAIFGGIDIIPPSGFKVETSGVALIGGCDNRVIITNDENMPVFTIKFFTFCGGIDIVNTFN